MRGFLAIELSNEAKDYVYSKQEELLRLGIKGKCTRQDNFHLTVKFLGELTDTEADQVDKLTCRIASGQNAFNLETAVFGAFQKGSRSVLWLGVKHEPELFQLYNRVNEATGRFAKQPEKDGYFPHITLIREASGCVPTLMQTTAGSLSFNAGGLSFMESKREDGKLIYARRTFAPFQASPQALSAMSEHKV